MRWIRGPGGILFTLITIVALMLCTGCAFAADQSLDIDNTQAIVAIVENGQVEVFVQFHATLLDGTAIRTELVVDYRGENVVLTSDSVGISGESVSFHDADSHFFGATATHAIIEQITTPATTRSSDVPGIVLNSALGASSTTVVLDYALLMGFADDAVLKMNFFTQSPTPRGALMPGDNSVVQHFHNTATSVKAYGDAVGVIHGGCYVA